MKMDSDEESELKNLAKVMAFLHTCFHNGYDVDIVLRFLDEKFIVTQKKYWTTTTRIVLGLKLAALLSGATLSPYLYANYLMNYPCKASPHILGNGPREEEVTLAGVGCEAQDTVRSAWVLLAVPCAMFLTIVLAISAKICDALFLRYYPKASYGPGEYIQSMCKRNLMSITASKLDRVKYANSLFYNLTCAMYFILLAEFAAMSVYMESAVAALVGYAISQAYLSMAATALPPNQDYIAKVQGLIACWPEEDNAARGVLQRLAQQRGGSAIYATVAELKSLARLDKLCKAIGGDKEVLKQYEKKSEQEKSYSGPFSRISFFKSYSWYFRDIRLDATGLFSATKVFVIGSDNEIDLLEESKQEYEGEDASSVVEQELSRLQDEEYRMSGTSSDDG